MDLRSFLDDYGLLAVLVGTFFEGETILVLGGIAAKMGHLSLPMVMLMAFIGSLLGDQLWFFVGRFGGDWVMRRRPQWKPGLRKALERLERNQVWFILVFRFLYGLRTVAPFAIGMSRVRTPTYVILNVIGAAIWAVAVALLGYVFGHAVEVVLGDGKRWFLLALALALVVGLFMWWRRGRSMRRAAQTEAVSHPMVVPVSTLTGIPPLRQRDRSKEDITPLTNEPLRDPGP